MKGGEILLVASLRTELNRTIMIIETKTIDIKKLISDFKKEHTELGEIINPILKKYDLEKKEFLEVCQIGKFIYKINSEMRITDKPKPPSPDFIIEHASKLIGLEHTRIPTDNAENYYKVITLFNYAEDIYRAKFPNETIHATISIQNDNIDYSQENKKELATEIANYVYNFNKGIQTERPFYISVIRTTIYSKVTFTYKEINWEGPYLTKERLETEIRKKEKKLDNYKKGQSETSQYWLVLLIGSLNSASYQLNENENYETQSDFDRVYLMTDFDAEIIRVK